MGIQGLLPFLKKIHEPVNVSKFSGCTVAIDSYCWLHKGAFSCAEKLALGEKTDQYVYYCIKFINYLLSKNIKPIMVFDGCHLPSKKAVETSRREKRDLNRKKAAQFLREGRRAEARECLQKCIDISPEMALELMNVCRDKGVDCIVAPYEADAQLAYLNKIGVAQVIITEDSDLLLFGCEKVIFKMDHAGNGILIEQRRLNEVLDVPSTQYTFEKFRYTCILSGCDYLPSLPGIGLAKATKVFKIARQGDVKQLLKKLSTYLKSNITVPDEYIEGFIAADNTFLYQLVYDPLRRKLVPLNPYPSGLGPELLPYAGAQLPDNKALQIALGNINIYSGEKFANYDPDTFVPKYVKKPPEMLHLRSIWDRCYRVRPKVPLHETQAVERPTLRGKEVPIKATVKRYSPRKRVREEDEAQEAKANSELSKLYSREAPNTKRLKTDIDEELQRFIFTPHREDDVEEEEEAEDVVPEPPGTPKRQPPPHSPMFFNSLSEAHPIVEVAREGVDEEEEEKENSPVSEELLKSPRRNVFASKSPSKKQRFNLNATKPVEVKSRFFAGSTKTAPKLEYSAMSPSKSRRDSDYKPVHSNSANLYNTKGITSPAKKSSPVHSPRKSIARKFSFDNAKNHSSSPHSAFKWSKFSFTKSQSADNLNSKLGNVKTEITNNEDLIIGKGDDCDVSTESGSDRLPPMDSQTSTMKTSLPSQESYPYSIDSMCMEMGESQPDLPQSPGDEKSTKNNPETYASVSQNSNSASQSSINQEKSSSQPKGISLYFKKGVTKAPVEDKRVSDAPAMGDVLKTNANNDDGPMVMLIDSDEEDFKVTNSQSSSSQSSSSQTSSSQSSSSQTSSSQSSSSQTSSSQTSSSQTSTKSQGSFKPGCRVSGLSRKSRKSSTKTSQQDNKQKNLKDMFMNFSYNKSSQQKLNHNNG